MGVNSRRKGDKGEKLAAELIAKWTGKKFKRAETNNYIHKRDAHNSKGDIVCITEGHYYPFCTEVKNYKEINFEHLLYLPKPLIVDFWKQATTDAKLCGKCPLLFMRYNGLPKEFFFVAIPPKIYDQFFSEHIKLPKSLRMEFYGFILITTNELFQVPYKSIRKSIKLHYKNEKA